MNVPAISDNKKLMEDPRTNSLMLLRLLLIGRLDEALHKLDNVHIRFIHIKAQYCRLVLHYYTYKLKKQIIDTPSNRIEKYESLTHRTVIDIITFCMVLEYNYG